MNIIRKALENRTVMIALCAIPLVYIFLKVIYDPPLAANDFKFFWLAGHMWGDGQNPYGPDYARAGQVFFDGDVVPFFYPPHWYLILRAVAAFSFEHALLLWRLISMAAIFASLLLWLDVLRRVGAKVPHVFTILFVWIAFFSNSTAIIVSNGQTSAVICLGVSLFFWAWVARNRMVMTLALWTLMLKPNIGMYFCFVLLAAPYWWPALIAGAVAVIASSLPALYPFGAVQTIMQVLDGLKQFELVPANEPSSMTGFRTLVFYATGITIPAIWSMVSGYILGLAIGVFSARHRLSDGAADAGKWLISAALIIALGAFLIPLHTYDLTFVAPLALLAWGMRMPLRIALCACLIVFVRAANVASALGLFDPKTLYHPESYFVSLILAAITIICATAWIMARAGRSGKLARV